MTETINPTEVPETYARESIDEERDPMNPCVSRLLSRCLEDIQLEDAAIMRGVRRSVEGIITCMIGEYEARLDPGRSRLLMPRVDAQAVAAVQQQCDEVLQRLPMRLLYLAFDELDAVLNQSNQGLPDHLRELIHLCVCAMAVRVAQPHLALQSEPTPAATDAA